MSKQRNPHAYLTVNGGFRLGGDERSFVALFLFHKNFMAIKKSSQNRILPKTKVFVTVTSKQCLRVNDPEPCKGDPPKNDETRGI